MAKPPIRIKRSAVTGAIPTTAQLQLGELAINTFDGKLFLKKDDGTASIVEIGGGGGGSYTSPSTVVLYNKNDSGSTASFDGTETRFQLRDSSGTRLNISNALYLAISVNGVIQKPNTGTPSSPFEGFYVTANATSGYDIVFDSAPATSSDFFGVLSGTFATTAGTSGIKVLDDISSQFNDSTVAFTLKYNTANYAPEFTNAVIISVGGVVQVPTSAYSISGSTITFTSAPPTGATFYGLSLEIGQAAEFDLLDSTSSTSTTTAATSNSVKSAYDLANAALPKAGGTMTGNITFNGTQTFPGTVASTGGTVTGNVTLDNQADLRFGEATANGTNWVAFQAPSSITSNVIWTLPATDASVAGYALKSDGAGNLSWGLAGGALGGGSDQVFYENDSVITSSYTIGTNKNAMTAGPVTINNSVVVTIPSGSSWVIV